mgnify:CR=1 FL=1
MVTAMHLAEASLCMGIVKTVTALIKLGKIKVNFELMDNSTNVGFVWI